MSQLQNVKKYFTGNKALKLALVATIGVVIGFGSSKALTQDQVDKKQGYCDRIESQVVQKRNFSGTLACFKPGIVNVNLSEKVEENSKLKCVCRHSYKGLVQLIPISVSN